VNESGNLTPPPKWHPPWFNYCLDLLIFIMVYPIGYSLTLGSFFAMTFYEYILYVPDFISMVEHYNRIGYLKLFYPIHILATKQWCLALCNLNRKYLSVHWSMEFIQMLLISIGTICFSWNLHTCPLQNCCTDYWPCTCLLVAFPKRT
jgi:hypothetical protein